MRLFLSCWGFAVKPQRDFALFYYILFCGVLLLTFGGLLFSEKKKELFPSGEEKRYRGKLRGVGANCGWDVFYERRIYFKKPKTNHLPYMTLLPFFFFFGFVLFCFVVFFISQEDLFSELLYHQNLTLWGQIPTLFSFLACVLADYSLYTFFHLPDRAEGIRESRKVKYFPMCTSCLQPNVSFSRWSKLWNATSKYWVNV